MTAGSDSPPLIRAVHLKRTYRMEGVEIRALQDASLEVRRGEFVAIMGPSGSGKSTLMHLLGCLDTPDEGTLFLEGREVNSLDSDSLARVRNSRIGFVFQDFNLFPRSSAIENVEMPLVFAGIHPAERRKRALAALEAVGLAGRGNHFPNQLSGGEQQRVAVARALAANPVMILADEPTGNLDSRNGLEVMGLFRSLHRQGITIVIITHDPQVASFADRFVRMGDGRIQEDRKNEAQPLEAPTQAAAAKQIPGGESGDFLRSGFHWMLLGQVATSVRLAWLALWRNPIRSLLTTLGIIIGVGSIITLTAVGKNVYLVIQNQIFKLAKDLVTVQPSYKHHRNGKWQMGKLTEDDADAIRQVCQNALAVVPEMGTGGNAVFRNRSAYVIPIGTTRDCLMISGGEIGKGHLFSAQEYAAAAKVCVLPQEIADKLFPDCSPLGKTIEIRNVPFEVIGVLSQSGGNLSRIFSGIDQKLLIPLSTFKRRLERNQTDLRQVEKITILADSADSLGPITRQVRKLLRWRHGIPRDQPLDVYAKNTEEIALIVGMMLMSIFLFIVAIASISLVVGGIGIMNIMLVSVTERTREIGISMAIGARRADVLRQFLIESVTLSGIGGWVGIIGGILLAFAAQITMEMAAIGPCKFDVWAFLEVVGRFLGYPWISLGIIGGAFGFSATIGIFFGLYPAWRASRLDPIRALRTL